MRSVQTLHGGTV